MADITGLQQQQHGGGADAAAAAAVVSASGLAGRAVLLGFQLFLAHEYGAMRRLVQLVGGEEPSEAGLQFILGLSIACGMKQHQRPAAQQQRPRDQQSSSEAAAQLDSAVGHLFRAAEGLCAAEAGPLRVVLQLLRSQLSSADTPKPPPGAAPMDTDDGQQQADQRGGSAAGWEQQQGAALRLQFAQCVMLLFEQSGVKEGALAFARAALGVADEAYGPEQQEQKLQQQGTACCVCRGVLCFSWLQPSATLPCPRAAHPPLLHRRPVCCPLLQRRCGETSSTLRLTWA
jgi:hypothetical protein